MSRTRTRTTDRVLETFGVAKKSVNAEYADALERHSRCKMQVQNVRNLLSQYYASVLATADMSWNMTAELREFYGKDSADKGPMGEFTRVHELMDKRIPVKMQGAFQKVIIEPLDAWAKQLADVKELEDAYEDARLQYDHYKRKVKSLDDQRIARVNKQKAVKPKEMDRLMRNREKLQEAEKKYDAASKQAVETMTAHWEARVERMDGLLMRVMQFQSQFFKELSTMASHLDTMVEAMRRKLDPESPEWSVMVERFEPVFAEETRVRELVEQVADKRARRRLQDLAAVMDADASAAAAAAVAAVRAGGSDTYATAAATPGGADAGAVSAAGASAGEAAAAAAEMAAAMRPKRRSWAFWRKGDGTTSPTAQTSAPAPGAAAPSPTEQDESAAERPGKPAPAPTAATQALGSGAASDAAHASASASGASGDADPDTGATFGVAHMPAPLRPQVHPPPATAAAAATAAPTFASMSPIAAGDSEAFPGDPSPLPPTPSSHVSHLPPAPATGAAKTPTRPFDPFAAAAATAAATASPPAPAANNGDPADSFGSMRPAAAQAAPHPGPGAFGSVAGRAQPPMQQHHHPASLAPAGAVDPFAAMATSGTAAGADDDWFGHATGTPPPAPPPRPQLQAPASAPAPAPVPAPAAPTFNPFFAPAPTEAPAPAPAPAPFAAATPSLPRVSPVNPEGGAALATSTRLSAPAGFGSPPSRLAPPAAHRSARVVGGARGGAGGGLSSALRAGGAQAPAAAVGSTNPFESLMQTGAPTPGPAAAVAHAAPAPLPHDPFAGFGSMPMATQPGGHEAPAPPGPASAIDPVGFDSLL